MIIQVRGTSGSGKSTVVRQVMGDLSLWTPQYVTGRNRPLYYRRGDIVVLGSYKNPCGGGDLIGSPQAIFHLIQQIRAKVILVESLLLSWDTKWSGQLKIKGLRVLFLTTPLEQCLERIRKRRELAGNNRPLNPYHTTVQMQRIERTRLKLIALGVHCCKASDEQAPKIIQQWIEEQMQAKTQAD